MTTETPDPGLLTKVMENLGDSAWWGDNLAAFLVFSILVGFAVNMIRVGFSWIFTLEYRGWSIVVYPVGSDREMYEYPLLWEEAREMLGSKVKERQYIQSVMSSEGGWLENGEIKLDDPDHWVFKDKGNKSFVFTVADFPVKE